MLYRNYGNGGCGGGDHRGRHGQRRGRHGGEGDRARLFEQGDLRLAMLALVAEAPRHGYELIREIETRSGGAYAPSPGVIYPTLTFLEEGGLIEQAQSEGARRSYRITEAGRGHLAERQSQVDALMARLADARSESERGDILPVLRAMANLRNALRLRMVRGGVTAETARKAAALIDELAQRIEAL